MNWWQWVLLALGSVALLLANTLRVDAQQEMWSKPKASAQRQAAIWLVIAVWLFVFGFGWLP